MPAIDNPMFGNRPAIRPFGSGMEVRHGTPRQTRPFGGLTEVPQYGQPGTAPIQPSASPYSANGQYTSGITAGPVYSPQQASEATARLTNSMTRPMRRTFTPMTADQRSYVGDAYSQQMGQQSNEASQGLQRGIATSNAAQTLQSQSARANAGIQGGQMLQDLAEQRWDQALPLLTMFLRSLTQ